jgi:hypothetical protein
MLVVWMATAWSLVIRARLASPQGLVSSSSCYSRANPHCTSSRCCPSNHSSAASSKFHCIRCLYMLQCGKPGPIPAPNAYARKASSRTSACSDKLKEKMVSDSEGEIVLIPHFSNIFTGHHYASRATFMHHRHNRCSLHSSDPFHGADPFTKPSDILLASELSPFRFVQTHFIAVI